MTMARGATEIDRLIEQGLGLYGEGDLDGALSLWERVLLIEPENAQATSYVDYVRMNYDLLSGDTHAEDSGPFAIEEDDPGYQIEILPGDGVEPVSAAPLYMDGRDEGWPIRDDSRELGAPAQIALELEADEPPLPAANATFENVHTGENVSFDDNTREYPSGAGRPTTGLLDEAQPSRETADFEPSITPAFGSSTGDLRTPQDFGSQVTDVRRRDLGFVQPRAAAESRQAAGPPELKMTLRTPVSAVIPVIAQPPAPAPAPASPAPDRHRTPTADGEPDEPPLAAGSHPLTTPAASTLEAAYAALDLEIGDPEPAELAALAPMGRTGPFDVPSEPERDEADMSDLISSLPIPRQPTSTTRPMPAKTRPPALEPDELVASDERPTRDLEPSTSPLLSAARTTELPPRTVIEPRGAQPEAVALTRDFSESPTRRRPSDNPMVSAPTRNLGLRDQAAAMVDEGPTGEVDPHRIRAGSANGALGRPPRETARGMASSAAPLAPRGRDSDVPAGTRTITADGPAALHDRRAAESTEPAATPVGGFPRPLDPIDAQSAAILEDVDRGAPVGESREDRTRRRITALLERAADWGRSNDVERAVTAADLALSEDPSSALAQKLIHRNRDAIMNAFQAFLGDLQRAPALARPLHELGSAPISPRAAFLLSRVDGTLSLDEILDVSGMPRLEAFRYLCQLYLRGILR